MKHLKIVKPYIIAVLIFMLIDFTFQYVFGHNVPVNES